MILGCIFCFCIGFYGGFMISALLTISKTDDVDDTDDVDTTKKNK